MVVTSPWFSSWARDSYRPPSIEIIRQGNLDCADFRASATGAPAMDRSAFLVDPSFPARRRLSAFDPAAEEAARFSSCHRKPSLSLADPPVLKTDFSAAMSLWIATRLFCPAFAALNPASAIGPASVGPASVDLVFADPV